MLPRATVCGRNTGVVECSATGPPWRGTGALRAAGSSGILCKPPLPWSGSPQLLRGSCPLGVRQFAQPVELRPKGRLRKPALGGVKALHVPHRRDNPGEIGIRSRLGQGAGAVQDSATLLVNLVVCGCHRPCAFFSDVGLEEVRPPPNRSSMHSYDYQAVNTTPPDCSEPSQRNGSARLKRRPTGLRPPSGRDSGPTRGVSDDTWGYAPQSARVDQCLARWGAGIRALVLNPIKPIWHEVA
jgi:hypothetical protein